ncbi:M15 family metallopeptidase [Pseudoduganella sp. LjRoot289]|uniref:M15 family metallopeptidase n=1 Tax=Pseudoduganella sp. LjRoot289 TaxID=3342314 RepID=UPI003ED10433
MLVFSLLLLFLFSCLAAWMLLFPAARGLWMASAQEWLGRVWRRRREARRSRKSRWHALGSSAYSGLLQWHGVLLRHAWLVAGGALMLLLPPTLALLAGRRLALPAFDGAGHEANSQVAELLKGERLAAPPPLPPLVFTTAEVNHVRPLLAGASRSWQLFHPGFEQRLLLVFRIMKERHGYEMALLEGYRSPERQDLLASAGASITNAKAFQSYHQFGLAADCAFLRDGKLVISEKDPWAMRGYRLYGEVAEAAGLTWGGRWTMMDFGHAELRLAGTLQRKR